jgi:hypothetical protein
MAQLKYLSSIVLGRTNVSIKQSNLSGIVIAKEIKGYNILYRIDLENNKYIWLPPEQFKIIK